MRDSGLPFLMFVVGFCLLIIANTELTVSRDQDNFEKAYNHIDQKLRNLKKDYPGAYYTFTDTLDIDDVLRSYEYIILRGQIDEVEKVQEGLIFYNASAYPFDKPFRLLDIRDYGPIYKPGLANQFIVIEMMSDSGKGFYYGHMVDVVEF